MAALAGCANESDGSGELADGTGLADGSTTKGAGAPGTTTSSPGGDTVTCEKRQSASRAPTMVTLQCTDQGPGRASVELEGCLPGQDKNRADVSFASRPSSTGTSTWKVTDSTGAVVAERTLTDYGSHQTQYLQSDSTSFTMMVEFPAATTGLFEGTLFCYQDEY